VATPITRFAKTALAALLALVLSTTLPAQSPSPQPSPTPAPDYQALLDSATAVGFDGFSQQQPATQEEYREYIHLLSQIVEMRTFLADSSTTAGFFRDQSAKVLQQIESFRPPETTPDTALTLYDEYRLSLWQAENWISALEKISANRADQAAKAFQTLKDAQQKLQSMQSGGPPAGARQAWELTLQQTRVDAALVEQSVRSNTAIPDAEMELQSARRQLANLYIEELKKVASFPDSLLQSLLEAIDKSGDQFASLIEGIEARLKNFAARNPAAGNEFVSNQLLISLQNQLQLVEQRRVLLMVRSQLLQARHELWNATDAATVNEAAALIDDRAQDALVWQPLVSGLRTRLQDRRRQTLQTLAMSTPPAAESTTAFVGKAFDDEESNLSAWENDFSSISQLISLCHSDLDSKRKALGLAKNLDAAAGSLASKAGGVWNAELFTLSDSVIVNGQVVQIPSPVTLGMLATAIAILVVGGIASNYSSRWLRARVSNRMQLDANTGAIVEKFTYYFLLIAVCLVALAVVRIPLTIFALLGGAAAIAVGFGAQQLVNNLISGIILLFERPIRIGDQIDVGTYSGTVTAIGTRCCQLLRHDGVEILIPNSVILQGTVVNHTLSDTHARQEIQVGIAYGSPVEKAMETILGILESHPDVLKTKQPCVFFNNFGPDSIDLRALFWVDQQTSGSGTRVPSEIRLAIYNKLQSAGISLPFPQRDVHLDTPRPLQVEVLPRT
jgi:small-conductance mechanosensitive channel